jgi:hypothetical protein
MHQRDLAIRTWKELGLGRGHGKRLQAFLKHADSATGDCWAELPKAARELTPSEKRLIVEALWKTGDKLLRVKLIRAADPSRPDELQMLIEAANACDIERDGAELRVLLETEHSRVHQAVAAKPNLPRGFRLLLLLRAPQSREKPGLRGQLNPEGHQEEVRKKS